MDGSQRIGHLIERRRNGETRRMELAGPPSLKDFAGTRKRVEEGSEEGLARTEVMAKGPLLVNGSVPSLRSGLDGFGGSSDRRETRCGPSGWFMRGSVDDLFPH
jgi:hypothetical protein